MQTQTQASKLSIKKNDLVEVISGKEKGKTGKVLSVDSVNGRIAVEKINMVKRHVKPNQKNPQGGVVEKELPLHYSNVLLVCAKCNRGVRHGKRFEAKAASKKAKKGASKAADDVQVKVRFCKKCETTIG